MSSGNYSLDLTLVFCLWYFPSEQDTLFYAYVRDWKIHIHFIYGACQWARHWKAGGGHYK